MDKIPVLVTGGAGYIGSHAVLALRDAGWPVAVIDDLSTGFRWAVPEGMAFYAGDIADAALLTQIFAEQGTRAVMHFAGSIIVPESVADPLKYYANNTGKSRALIASCVAAGVPHLIFSSTAAVYGAPAAQRVGEDTPTVPINPYGRSKLMTEAMLPIPPPRTRSTIARCAISTSPGPIRRRARGNRPQARRTCSRSRSKQPWANASSSVFMVAITRQPTAPACAITSMSPIWPPRTSWRSRR